MLAVAKVPLYGKGKNCADGWSLCHKDTFKTLHTVNLSARYGNMVGLMFGNHFPQRNNFFYSLFRKWLGLRADRGVLSVTQGDAFDLHSVGRVPKHSQQLSVGRNMDLVKCISLRHCLKCSFNKYNLVDKVCIRITQTLSWALMHFAV